MEARHNFRDNAEIVPSVNTASNTSTDEVTGLVWHDGVGSLPGSNLKFRKNEYGGIEVVMDTLNLDLKSTERPMQNQVTNYGGKESEWRFKGQPQTDKVEQVQRDRFIPTDAFDEDDTTNTQNMPNVVSVKNESEYSTDVQSQMMISKLEKRDTLFPRYESSIHDFDWNSYLIQQRAIAAPENAFYDVTGRHPFPREKMKFCVGDLLESVDPLHQSLICAVSVVEVKGCRMRLHFEGYATLHDFWVNSEDKLLFPCGFCQITGRKLHPPKNYASSSFSWESYSCDTGKQLCGADKFREDIGKCYKANTKFEIGDKLEAVDRSNPQFTCVASVSDIIDDRVLIHFDSWNHNFDYWCDNKSQYIHPIGWCENNDKALSVPQGYEDGEEFTWNEYLKATKSKAASPEAFALRTSHQFEIGMRLEVVDKRNPILIRVATVEDKTGHQIKIHFDGWDELYDYWIDVDSPDLHPVTWCAKTGHVLQPNITEDERQAWQGGCPIPGCRGIGHIKGSKFVGHHSEYGCPYSSKNLDSYPIQDRIMPRRGPKPSSLMSRRMASFPSDREKSSAISDSERRRSIQRRASRNSLYGDRERNDMPMLYETTQNDEPPCKKAKHIDSKVDGLISNNGSNLRYSILTATIWSAFPDKNLAQYWEQCVRLLPESKMTTIRGSEVSRWSAEQVAEFVSSLTGQEKYGQLFLNEEIDGEAFLLLSQNDIFKVLNIKLGPTLKIHGAILYARANE